MCKDIMSPKTKLFGSGAVISAIVIFTMTGVFGWIGVTTADVPALKAQSKVEFKNLNFNVDKLTKASINTNKAILDNSDKQDSRMHELTNIIYSLGIEVSVLKRDCAENHKDIGKCQEHKHDNNTKDDI